MGYQIITTQTQEQKEHEEHEYARTCPCCAKKTLSRDIDGESYGFLGFSFRTYAKFLCSCGAVWVVDLVSKGHRQGFKYANTVRRIVRTPERKKFENEQLEIARACPACQHKTYSYNMTTQKIVNYHNHFVTGVQQKCSKCNTTYQYTFPTFYGKNN